MLSLGRALRARAPRGVVLVLQVGVVVALLAGTVAFVRGDHTVTITVDGQARQVHTYSTKVEAVLAAAHLSVGPHDEVAPALAAHVGNDGTIAIRRGRLITLSLDKTTREVWVTQTSVDSVLSALDLNLPGEFLDVSRSRPIGLEGAAFSIRLPQQVTLVHDGVAQRVTTTAPSVGVLLSDAHITLGPADQITEPKTVYPVQGMVIRVIRIHGAQEIDDEVIPVVTQNVNDAALYTGVTQTVSAGRPGVIRVVYSLRIVDGILQRRTLVSRTETVSMQPTVIDVGTTTPPPPPPAASVTYDDGNGLDWQALADCESGGDPTSVSAGGLYFGLYQFMLGTWYGVGGTGNPIDASAAQQTYRAELLYARDGRSAWPVCGQYL